METRNGIDSGAERRILAWFPALSRQSYPENYPQIAMAATGGENKSGTLTLEMVHRLRQCECGRVRCTRRQMTTEPHVAGISLTEETMTRFWI